jgi:hypothetical protein
MENPTRQILHYRKVASEITVFAFSIDKKFVYLSPTFVLMIGQTKKHDL